MNQEEEEELELDNENYNVKELEKIIKEKIIKNIYKFKYTVNGKETQGTGFLCKINFINNSNMPVLITCYHLLEDAFSTDFTSLSFYHFVKGIKKEENLKLNEDRIIGKYKEKKYDIVIIEIKEKDNLDIFDFLNIDNSVNF